MIRYRLRQESAIPMPNEGLASDARIVDRKTKDLPFAVRRKIVEARSEKVRGSRYTGFSIGVGIPKSGEASIGKRQPSSYAVMCGNRRWRGKICVGL